MSPKPSNQGPGSTRPGTPAGLIPPPTRLHQSTATGLRGLWQQSLGIDVSALSNVGHSFRPGVAGFRGPAGQPGFRRESELGRGGMGVVWRGTDLTLGRGVAIKTLAPGGGLEEREAFTSEARVTAFLDHPNIVPIYQLSETPEGELELAMKVVGGRSWKAILKAERDLVATGRGAVEVSDLSDPIAILRSVCQAVAFAHSRGFVHLDLKPENVMVGEFGEVLVLDWGLALDLRAVPDHQRLTISRESITTPRGTPSYMAPELAEGQGAMLGPWTDIYLLGAMLHEVLTGAPPHSGGSVMAALMKASTSAPPSFPEGTAPELADICRRAMAREPGERPRSVREVLLALDAYEQHRESRQIEAGARSMVARADELSADALAPGAGSERKSALYDAYASAIAGFEQALVLWPDNPEATARLESARRSYAEVALKLDDLALAEAQARALPGDATLLMEIRAATEERRRSRSVQQGLKWSLAITALVLVVGSLVAVWQIRESEQEAIRRQREADASRRKALQNAELAEQRRKQAERALAVAGARFDELEFLSGGIRNSRLLDRAVRLWPESTRMIPALRDWLRDVQPALDSRAQADKIRPRLAADRLETFDILVEQLEALEKQARSVRRRLERARQVRVATLEGEAGEAWDRAIRSIADTSECPLYRGLKLEAFEGFVPLRRDPASGLWEFWHWASGDMPGVKGGGFRVEGGSGLIFVLVPGGTFRMGAEPTSWRSADESPVRAIAVPPFLLCKTEFPQVTWKRLMGRNPSVYKPTTAKGITGFHPVENLTWLRARAACFRLGLSLPTEAQWEYACRAGTTTEFWFGGREKATGTPGRPAVNFADRSFGRGHGGAEESLNDGFALHAPIFRATPNPWGFFHITGNVSEWCLDEYRRYQLPGDWRANRPDGEEFLPASVRAPRSAGTSRPISRVVRGGSYQYGLDAARSSDRMTLTSTATGPIGLRPAFNIPAKQR